MPVYLMASFARSGETLLLRALNAHPKITVLHQIFEPDSKPAKAAVERISKSSALHAWIPGKLRKRGSSILLVKHGVWSHQYPHRGFTFSRNPFSVVASQMRFSIDNNEAEDRRRRRLIRFATGIDSTLTTAVRDMPEVEAIARLYLAKMKSALETGHPVFRYENLTSNPKSELSAILDALGLPWDESVLWSEKSYPAGVIGHGGIDLSRPIQTGIPVYAGGLTDEEFETVARITEPILKPLGYSDLLKS